MNTRSGRRTPQIRLLLVGGGSGGHITPVVALAKEIKKQQPNWQLSYVGSTDDPIGQRLVRGQAQLFSGIHFLPAGKFRRFSFRGWSVVSQIWSTILNIRDVAKAIAGLVGSLYLLRRNRPNLIFSKGGYPALGPCLAARILRIPLVVHDSDSVPGLTHRLVGRWAEMRLTGLPAINPQPNERYVGVPVAPRLSEPLVDGERQAILASYDLQPDTRLVLVFGGGLGAVNLNRVVLETIDELKLPAKVHFILVTGSANHQTTAEAAAALKRRDRLSVLGFVDNLVDLIRVAEVVVTRAGATALSEVTAAAKPAIVIPKPFMPGNHQVHNANIYHHSSAALIVADNGQRVNRRSFISELEALLASAARRQELSQAIGQLAKTAAVTQTLESIREVLARQLRFRTVETRDWTRYYLRYRNLAIRQAAAADRVSDRRRLQLRRQWRLGTWLAIGLAAIVSLRLFYVGDIRVEINDNPRLSPIGQAQVAELEREVATNLAPDIWPYPSLNDWLSRRFRPRFDDIEQGLMTAYPYLESVQVRRDWWLSEATLLVEPQSVVGVVRHDNQAAVLIASGFVLSGYSEIIDNQDLVRIWVDFDLKEVVWQRPVLSPAEIRFIEQVGDYFFDQGQRVNSFRTSTNPKEFRVKLAGYDFQIIMTTAADPVIQSVAAVLAIEDLEAKERDLPREYLDVRLLDRVVYK